MKILYGSIKILIKAITSKIEIIVIKSFLLYSKGFIKLNYSLPKQFNNKNVGVTTFQTLARLQGVLMVTCCEQKIEYIIVPPATWRAHCEVKGRTRVDRKRSMQMKVKDWFDITVNDDIADAIGIGKYINDKHKKKVEIFNWE